MLSLKNLKILIEEELVGLKILVRSYLSLRVVGRVYQVVQYDLFTTSLSFVLALKNLVNDRLSTKARPENHFELVKHQKLLTWDSIITSNK